MIQQQPVPGASHEQALEALQMRAARLAKGPNIRAEVLEGLGVDSITTHLRPLRRRVGPEQAAVAVLGRTTDELTRRQSRESRDHLLRLLADGVIDLASVQRALD